MSVTKVCGSCKKELGLNGENFAIHKRNKDGFSSMCKPCKREYDKEYRAKNKGLLAEKNKEYRENNPNKVKARLRKWYEENQGKVKQYRECNKESTRERNRKFWAENKDKEKNRIKEWRKENAEHIRQYRKDNRERDKEQTRKWYSTKRGRSLSMTRVNRRRAKIRTLPNEFTAEQWLECLIYFDNCCAYCGENYEKLEQEHFVPISKNGAFIKSNIVPSCRSCNASKSDKSFFDWYPNYEHYSKEREGKVFNYLGIIKNECGVD